MEYTPAFLASGMNVGGVNREDIIRFYYQSGYTIDEIIGFLALRHGIALSKRQLHRILRRMDLRRIQNESNLIDIVTAIASELSGSGRDIGYRAMRLRLLTDHRLLATNETVRLALSLLDSEGVMARRSRRIRRRTYFNSGPNFALHVDGWDKLKPFGISVHGAIDGYSRKIIWLKACDSNKKPSYVSRFYLDYVRAINGVPVVVYADRGTENSLLRDLQYALRWNHQDRFQGLSSFLYGSSTRNTRIERFWKDLKNMCGFYWINFFKELADLGILDTSDDIHMECVRYCFLPLIDSDLQRVVQHWNQHRIRPSRNAEVPAGIPDVLYYQPEVFGTRDCKMDIIEDTELLRNSYSQPLTIRGTSPEFRILAQGAVQGTGLRDPPITRDEALDLFCAIVLFVEFLEGNL